MLLRQAIDENGDGSLQFDEFLAWFLAEKDKRLQLKKQKALEAMKTDPDGMSCALTAAAGAEQLASVKRHVALQASQMVTKIEAEYGITVDGAESLISGLFSSDTGLL